MEIYQKLPLKSSKNRGNPKINPKLFRGQEKWSKKLRKQPVSYRNRLFYGCGGRTRTYDLRVMSPTSFQLLYSAIFTRSPECLDILTQRASFVKTFFLFFKKIIMDYLSSLFQSHPELLQRTLFNTGYIATHLL